MASICLSCQLILPRKTLTCSVFDTVYKILTTSADKLCLETVKDKLCLETVKVFHPAFSGDTHLLGDARVKT